MKIYFKSFPIIFAALFLWLESSAHSLNHKTYKTSELVFLNTIKDSLIIVRYPGGGQPDMHRDVVYVENGGRSAPLHFGSTDMVGLFRFIDVGVPKPSAVTKDNKTAFIRALGNPTWFRNTHFMTPQGYSFYKLANFGTDEQMFLKVVPNIDVRRGKPELIPSLGVSIIPILKPSVILK